MYSMFVEYVCRDCNIKELRVEIIPKHSCWKCGKWFEVIEEVGDGVVAN